MSLNVALNTAVSGLFANQKAIAATSENIANVNTPDYVRRRADFHADAIPGQFAGVDVEIARAAVNRFLQGAGYRASGDSGRSRVVADSLANVEASLGAPGENVSYSNLLDEAFAALTILSANPSSLAARADALAALDNAFRSFSRTQDAIANEIVGADDRLEIGTARASALLEEIYRLNASVPDSPSAGDLMDARLTELSRLLSITVSRNDLGQAIVSAADGTVLASPGGYAALGVGAPGTVTLSSVAPESGALTLVSADFGAAIASGEIRGLLELRNNELPALSALVLNAAGGIAAQLNAVHAGNYVVGATAPSADALIVQELDGRFIVNPVLIADASRLAVARPGSGAAGANDGAGAALFADVAASSAARDVAQSVALIGSASRNASVAASTDDALAKEISSRIASEGGVNLDEELSNLILYQRAYGANARVIAAVDELWQTLLAII